MSALFKGRQMVEVWNLLGLDAATFGNHEFDFGPAVLRQRMDEPIARARAALAEMGAVDLQVAPTHLELARDEALARALPLRARARSARGPGRGRA